MKRILLVFFSFCVLMSVLTYGGEGRTPFSFKTFFERCAELPSKPSLPNLDREWKVLIPVIKPSLPADSSILAALTYLRRLFANAIPAMVNAIYNLGTLCSVLYDIIKYVWLWLIYLVDVIKTFAGACGWSLS